MTHPKTLAVIRVFSSADQKVLEKHAKIIEKLYGIPTRTYCIPNQPEGIANEEIAKDCVERIVEQCLRAEKDGADAVLVSCAIDPGVEAARKVCRIPVFGAGSCAAAMALTMGSRVGVLSLIAGDVLPCPAAFSATEWLLRSALTALRILETSSPTGGARARRNASRSSPKKSTSSCFPAPVFQPWALPTGSRI